MTCKNCGHTLEEDAVYCSHCGSIVNQQIPNQSPPNPQSPNPQSPNLQSPNQQPPYQQSPYPQSSYPQPSYQQSPNQIPPNWRPPIPPPGVLPPPVPPQFYVPPKKSKVLLPLLIITVVIASLFVISMVILTAVGIYYEIKDADVSQIVNEYDQYMDEDFGQNNNDSIDGYNSQEDSGYEEIPDYDYYPEDETNPDDGSYSDYDTYSNYDTFIQGRELQYYEQYSEVLMENGIGFYLNDILVTDLGDGTATVDMNIDLISYYDENYLYNEDFLMLPMDKEGNALSDACSVGYIRDSIGNDITVPMLLNTEEYQNYVITFIVPTNMETFNVYGINYSTEGFSGPVYCTEMQVNE